MANITAQQVKELREQSGAGMMDCKKALVECDGDMAKAMDYLKEKGFAKAAKKGHFAKAGVSSKRFLKEFKFENASEYSLGQEIKVDIFAAGDKVDATGISKGKGFQGAIKRHGLSRGPMKHGSKYHRHAGSNGAATSPGRVFKGKHMPGQTGNVKVTVQNLEVVRIDAENNVILVKGAVPGPKKAMIVLRESVKKAN